MNKRAFIELIKIEQNFEAGDENILALQELSCVIPESSFTIIYGPSGSGKSTLLNIISGIQKPSKGRLIIDGFDVYKSTNNERARFRASKVGIVYQNNYWVKSLTVLDNVCLPLLFSGKSRTDAAKQAFVALERVNMLGYAKKYPSLLSGGEQQRIAVARALVNDPQFIIADEPTGSLDSKNGDMVMNILRQEQRESKRTIILVTHNMEYLPLADSLLHIKDGVVQVMNNSSIKTTTDSLINDMRKRIHMLSEEKRL